MTDQPALPGMNNVIPDAPHIFVRQVTEENIPLIAKESGKTEVELTAMLMARREMQGEDAVLRVRYLAVNYHKHEPKKHRDGKQRWCDICGLTGDGKVPTGKKAYKCPEDGCDFAVSSHDHQWVDERAIAHVVVKHFVVEEAPNE